MVKVSIIVPVYNVAEYLGRCLNTLVNQTLKEIEIIIVNDGSTDESPEIIQTFAEQYPEKITVLTKKNGGLSDARNYGIPYATGEYIGFIDSDDFVELDMMELLYNKAKEENADYVECNLYHTYQDKEDIEIGEHYFSKNDLIMFGRSVVWNKIYSRKWLLNTGVKFAVGLNHEDVDFFVRIVPYIRHIAYVENACVHYVQRCGSINNAKSKKLLDIHSIIEGLICYYKEQGIYEQYKPALEFLSVRILLASAFIRFCKIEDNNLRNNILEANWEFLKRYFPDWKNNSTLKKQKRLKYLYIRNVNQAIYKIMMVIVPILVRFRKV